MTHGARILVAEQTTAANSMRDKLTGMGYEVVAIANTGERALRLAERFCPDLAIIDMQIPGQMGGVAVAKAIRGEHGIPVIHILTNTNDEMFDEMLQADPMGFLLKPFSDLELSQTVRLGLYKAQIERQLKDSEAKYRQLFNTLPSGFAMHEIICDESGKPCDYRFIEVNESFEKLTGFSRKNIIGKTVRELMPKIEQYWIDMYGKVATTGQAMSFENYSTTLKKHYGCHAYRPAPGKFAVIFADITEKKLAMKLMQDVHAFQKTLIDTIPLPIFYKDANLRYSGCNRTFELFFGCRADKIEGKRVFELNIPPTIAEKYDQMDGELLKTGKPQVYECLLKNRQGQIRNIIFHKAIFLDSDGRPGGFVGAMLDITDQRDAMENERLRQEELAQAVKLAAIGTMVAGFAHDINNPTQYIQLNASMLAKFLDSIIPMLDEKKQADGDFNIGKLKYSYLRDQLPVLAQGIVDGAERIRKIVQELKDFAKPASAISIELICINDAVRSAAKIMGATIRRSTSDFRLELQENLPKVHANIQKLEQVIVNLVQNACQSLDDDSCAVGIRTICDRPNRQIVLEIWDQGRGIAPENIPNLTKPFFTTRRDAGGTGLGLAMSKRILDEIDATMIFASEPGRGTTVRVEIPTDEPV